MISIVIGAAVLGVIIAVMEGGEFPGWLKMFVCVLSAVIPSTIINLALPGGLFFVGFLVGSVCAAFVISGMCGMSVKRSFIAAAIYFVIQTLISGAFYLMFATR